MEVTYECKEPRLQKNFRHSIIARDEQGSIVGTYYGYWIPGLQQVALYPDHNHPAYKPGWRLVKKKVYDGYVKCRVQSVPHPPQAVPLPQGEGKGETWRDRKLPMKGQEKMKF